MSGFLRLPGLDQLRGAPHLLDVFRAALEAADAGPLPVHAFLATALDPPAGARPDGALSGVPVAVKDNIATDGLPTTCASRVLDGYRSPFEATVVRRLRAAGALIVGKTNLDEFAMGSSTELSAYGPTRNPADRTRVPGGSSGGSAAAVAAGIVPAALGSETGGSVRQPASFCGVVGLVPTYGRVSRHGLVAFASSFDQVGVLARTVADAAHVLEVIAGPDPLDPATRDVALPSEPTRSGAGLAGMVVGVPDEYFPDWLDPSVRRRCRVALGLLEGLGAEIRPLSLPGTSLAVPAYQVLAAAEASTNLARFDGVRFGRRASGAGMNEMYTRSRALFGAEVQRRVLVGTRVLSGAADHDLHGRARRARARVAAELRLAFDSGVDVLFTPTTPGPAFGLGERLDDPYSMYLSDAFTVGANLAGLPAMSLPIGAEGPLPIGGQLIGPAWGEAALFRAGRALEHALSTTDAAG